MSTQNTNTETFAVKDVLANPNHPAHAATKEMLEKLQKGEIALCACIGPLYGEPYCSCEMKRRGLPASEERKAATLAAETKLTELVRTGILPLTKDK